MRWNFADLRWMGKQIVGENTLVASNTFSRNYPRGDRAGRVGCHWCRIATFRLNGVRS
jgi:hypothetical protein